MLTVEMLSVVSFGMSRELHVNVCVACCTQNALIDGTPTRSSARTCRSTATRLRTCRSGIHHVSRGGKRSASMSHTSGNGHKTRGGAHTTTTSTHQPECSLAPPWKPKSTEPPKSADAHSRERSRARTPSRTSQWLSSSSSTLSQTWQWTMRSLDRPTLKDQRSAAAPDGRYK